MMINYLDNNNNNTDETSLKADREDWGGGGAPRLAPQIALQLALQLAP